MCKQMSLSDISENSISPNIVWRIIICFIFTLGFFPSVFILNLESELHSQYKIYFLKKCLVPICLSTNISAYVYILLSIPLNEVHIYFIRFKKMLRIISAVNVSWFVYSTTLCKCFNISFSCWRIDTDTSIFNAEAAAAYASTAMVPVLISWLCDRDTLYAKMRKINLSAER